MRSDHSIARCEMFPGISNHYLRELSIPREASKERNDDSRELHMTYESKVLLLCRRSM